MFHHELQAAGLRCGPLREAYQACGRYLAKRNSAAYPIARFLIPPERRPYYDSMLAFSCYVDDILDDSTQSIQDRDNAFTTFTGQFRAILESCEILEVEPSSRRYPSDANHDQGHLVMAAFGHFAVTWGISHHSIWHFLDTMRTDLTTHHYETFDDLERYMSGVSREAGQWVNILLEGRGTESAHKVTALGYGVYLLDFLTDIREDITLGRIYLPLDELRRNGVEESDLKNAAHRRQITEPIREMIANQAQRIRQYFDESDGWHQLVTPSCRELPRQYLNLGRNSLRLLIRSNYDPFRPRRIPRLACLGYAQASTSLSYLRSRRARRTPRNAPTTHWPATPQTAITPRTLPVRQTPPETHQGHTETSPREH